MDSTIFTAAAYQCEVGVGFLMTRLEDPRERARSAFVQIMPPRLRSAHYVHRVLRKTKFIICSINR